MKQKEKLLRKAKEITKRLSKKIIQVCGESALEELLQIDDEGDDSYENNELSSSGKQKIKQDH